MLRSIVWATALILAATACWGGERTRPENYHPPAEPIQSPTFVPPKLQAQRRPPPSAPESVLGAAAPPAEALPPGEGEGEAPPPQQGEDQLGGPEKEQSPQPRGPIPPNAGEGEAPPGQQR